MPHFADDIDLGGNQLKNAAIHQVADFPELPVKGQIVFLTETVDQFDPGFYGFDGSAWVPLG